MDIRFAFFECLNNSRSASVFACDDLCNRPLSDKVVQSIDFGHDWFVAESDLPHPVLQ